LLQVAIDHFEGFAYGRQGFERHVNDLVTAHGASATRRKLAAALNEAEAAFCVVDQFWLAGAFQNASSRNGGAELLQEIPTIEEFEFAGHS
jgi:hypothetical protein